MTQGSPARAAWWWFLAVSMMAILACPVLQAERQAVDTRAATLKEFRDRVDAYVRFRDKVLAGMLKLEETADPAEITGRERALGEAIRAARINAAEGEIFTPAVSRLLREAIRSNLSHRSPQERQAALASLPANLVLKVNDFYPPGIPLETVPPTLLAELPLLPDALEYRLVGDRLILRDIDANLVVDFVRDAVPRPRG